MFIWPLCSILAALQRHAPELASFVEALHASGDFATVLAARFPELPKISIDYAIMEKAERVLVVEAGFDWDDVGSWTAVAKYLRHDADENCSEYGAAHDAGRGWEYHFYDAAGQVALMGVRDLIVVQTDDALLVAHRSEAEEDQATGGQGAAGAAVTQTLMIDDFRLLI